MKTRFAIFILCALWIAGSCKVKKTTSTIANIPNSNSFAQAIQPDIWQAIGPFGSPEPLAGKGEWSAHGAGRFECIDVNSENENEILLGHASSGLFKTTDGGATWQQKLNFKFATGIMDILRFKKNEKHLIACSATDLGTDKQYGYGLIESFDAGETWQRNSLKYDPLEYNLQQQRAIALIDRNEQRLISVSNHHIYLSEDGARTWKMVYTAKENLRSVKVNPINEKHIVVAGNVLLVTTDGGVTWIDYTNDLCRAYGTVPGGFSTFEIVFSQKNANKLWIAVSHNSSYVLQANLVDFMEFKLVSKSQFIPNPFHMTIGIKWDPKLKTEQLLVGTTRLFKSVDYGISFTQITTPENGVANFAHDDVNSLDVIRNGNIYIVTDGGSDISKDEGITWQSITNNSKNLNATLLFGFDKAMNDVIMTGTQDEGIFTFKDNKWLSCTLYGDGGRVAAIADSLEFACGYSKACYTTKDEGKLFNYNHAGGEVNFFEFRMQYLHKSKALYLANQHLYKQYKGKNFEILTGSLSSERAIGAFWVNKDNPDEIWLSKVEPTWGGALVKKLYFTGDGGYTWLDKTANLPILNWRSITDIEVNDNGDIAVTLGGFDNSNDSLNYNKIYLSTDGGNTFLNISRGLSNHPVYVIEPVGRNWVCGNANGVFIKRGNENWQALSKDFPKTIVSEIKYFERERMLYVSTFGRGMWRIWLN